MDDFTLAAVSVVMYQGRPVLMYRWQGSTAWSSLALG